MDGRKPRCGVIVLDREIHRRVIGSVSPVVFTVLTMIVADVAWKKSRVLVFGRWWLLERGQAVISVKGYARQTAKSPATIRKALDELAATGYIRQDRQDGRGTIVSLLVDLAGSGKTPVAGTQNAPPKALAGLNTDRQPVQKVDHVVDTPVEEALSDESGKPSSVSDSNNRAHQLLRTGLEHAGIPVGDPLCGRLHNLLDTVCGDPVTVLAAYSEAAEKDDPAAYAVSVLRGTGPRDESLRRAREIIESQAKNIDDILGGVLEEPQ